MPKWQDERIRRGLSLAYDRDELLDIIYSGAGIVLPQMDWRFFWEEEPSPDSGTLGKCGATTRTRRRSCSPRRARRSSSSDLVYFNYSNVSNSLQNEVLLDQFSRIGVTLHPKAVDYTEYNSQWTTRSGESESFDGWASFNPTADHFVYGLNHSESGGNRNRINDPEIDAWAAQHQVELDPETRTELARNVWNKVLDQMYRIEKTSGYSAYLQQPWVRAVRYSARPAAATSTSTPATRRSTPGSTSSERTRADTTRGGVARRRPFVDPQATLSPRAATAPSESALLDAPPPRAAGSPVPSIARFSVLSIRACYDAAAIRPSRCRVG